MHVVTKDSNMLFYVSLLLSVFAIVCSLLVIPESPKYLHATGQYKEARSTLSYIASLNGESETDFDSAKFTEEV